MLTIGEQQLAAQIKNKLTNISDSVEKTNKKLDKIIELLEKYGKCNSKSGSND